jgi:hypothetical protein
MTDDLVRRLRDLAEEWFEMCDDIHEPLYEAADRIETQAVEIEQLLHDLERQMTIANEHVNELKAFRLEVSNAVKDACKFAKDNPDRWAEYLAIRFSFIITPKPKPDPLVEVMGAVDADRLRAALEAHGLEIREKGQC